MAVDTHAAKRRGDGYAPAEAQPSEQQDLDAVLAVFRGHYAGRGGRMPMEDLRRLMEQCSDLEADETSRLIKALLPSEAQDHEGASLDFEFFLTALFVGRGNAPAAFPFVGLQVEVTGKDRSARGNAEGLAEQEADSIGVENAGTHSPNSLEPRRAGKDQTHGEPKVDMSAVSHREQDAANEHEDLTLGHDFRGVSVYHLRTLFTDRVCAAGLNRSSRIYEIEPAVIRPQGAGVRCPRDGFPGAAYVDSVRGPDHAGLSTLMLSYTWGYALGEITDSLAQYCTDTSMEHTKTYCWICCLCINQHRVVAAKDAGQTVPFEAFQQEFGRRVNGIGHVVALMAPWRKPIYLTRVWCDFEMYTAVTSDHVDVTIIMPPREIDDLRASLQDKAGIDEVWHAMANVKVQEAEASIQEDRERILSLLAEGPGHDGLNHVVAKHLQKWVADSSEGHLRELLAEGELSPQVAGQLGTNIGEMLHYLGLYDRCEGVLEEVGQAHARAGALETPTHAALLRQVGIVKRKRGDFSAAEAAYSEALRIRRLRGALETLGGMSLLEGIAHLKNDQGYHQDALAACLEARQIAERLDVLETKAGGEVLTALGSSWLELGDATGALRVLAEARRAYEDAEVCTTPNFASLLTVAGRACHRLGDTEGAARDYGD